MAEQLVAVKKEDKGVEHAVMEELTMEVDGVRAMVGMTDSA